jgi:serine/threonine protein kinase
MWNNCNSILDLRLIRAPAEIKEILKLMLVKNPTKRHSVSQLLHLDYFSCNVESDEEAKSHYDSKLLM